MQWRKATGCSPHFVTTESCSELLQTGQQIRGATEPLLEVGIGLHRHPRSEPARGHVGKDTTVDLTQIDRLGFGLGRQAQGCCRIVDGDPAPVRKVVCCAERQQRQRAPDRPGTIDDALDTLHVEIGLDAPGADLFYADPYISLSSGVVSSAYLGTDYVNGVECHHLAFREAKTDWQLWVQVGDAPLPMK